MDDDSTADEGVYVPFNYQVQRALKQKTSRYADNIVHATGYPAIKTPRVLTNIFQVCGKFHLKPLFSASTDDLLQYKPH
jgi:hypothetical protein